MKITLTLELKQTLELRHTKVRDVHECDRIKAVLLSSEGGSITQISQALHKHEATISRHLLDFQNSQKLAPENGGSQSHLNKAQSAEFIRYYESLKASLSNDEPLLLMDGAHLTQAIKITAGWIKKGTDKPIETTGSRTQLNIIGAIKLGVLSKTITHQYKTVNGESICHFLEKIKLAYSASSTLNIILDGASYHRLAEGVEKAKSLNIKLHYLPSYSPNLNPIERLWKVMKEQVRNNKYFATAKKFRQQINHFFEVILPDISDSLDSRINDNFQVLISAS